MKKVLALALALVMALSMTAMAFAAPASPSDATTKVYVNNNQCPLCGRWFADEDAYNNHLALCRTKTCDKCGMEFANEADYNNHVQNCTVDVTKDYVDLTVKDILNMIIDIAKSSMGQWDNIEDVITRIIDFVENIGAGIIPEADVNGAIAELEGLNIPGISDLLDALKAKIKAMYAGEEATTVVETTAAEGPADTGSASVGIAVFAAVSVAAAAAYVCTKKN